MLNFSAGIYDWTLLFHHTSCDKGIHLVLELLDMNQLVHLKESCTVFGFWVVQVNMFFYEILFEKLISLGKFLPPFPYIWGPGKVLAFC